jgi:hypothetical protein
MRNRAAAWNLKADNQPGDIMRKPTSCVAIRYAAFLSASVLAVGCRDKAAALPPAEVSAESDIDEPATDAIVSAIKEAQEAAKSGGTATKVLGPDGTVEAGFAMPGVSDVGISVSGSSSGRKSSVAITVTLPDERPGLLTPKAFAALKPGMDYDQVAKTLGGAMLKGKLADNYTGRFVVVQGDRKIELSFEKGKVTAKNATGLD